MSTPSFSGWEDLRSSETYDITTNTIEAIDLALKIAGTGGVVAPLSRSSCYWLLNLIDDRNVTYKRPTTALPDGSERGELTAKSQQQAAYVALITMMGFVKDITARNHDAGLKRWKAGLAGLNLTDLLDDTVKKGLWDNLLATKAVVYSEPRFRHAVLTRYIAFAQDGSEKPTIVKAVLSQLALVYENAYLKTVVCMNDFITSGSPALIIPSIMREARVFKPIFDNISREEGTNFSTCRLLDNSRHQDLNHAKYPELYAATLAWAKSNRKVQKNYIGSKSIIDKAMFTTMAKKIMGVRSIRGLPQLAEEDKAWARTMGCNIDDVVMTEIDTILKEGRKRPREEETSESESESEDKDQQRRRRKRRH